MSIESEVEREMRVLLVDDHPAVLLGLKSLLSTDEGIEVVGEAGCAGDGLRLAEELEPDLVVLEVQMGRGAGGLEVCRRLKEFKAAPRVLAYTGADPKECLVQAVLAGADGYFHKGVSHAKLAEAMRHTCAGGRIWVVDVETEENPRIEKELKEAGLTPKELEVLAFVMKRYTNAEIAQELFVSLPTVKSHLTSIMRKLGVRKRQDLQRSQLAC